MVRLVYVLTLQGILEELLNRHEENDYDILQMGNKASLERDTTIVTRSN